MPRHSGAHERPKPRSLNAETLAILEGSLGQPIEWQRSS
jgi:hypothetical protein